MGSNPIVVTFSCFHNSGFISKSSKKPANQAFGGFFIFCSIAKFLKILLIIVAVVWHSGFSKKVPQLTVYVAVLQPVNLLNDLIFRYYNSTFMFN